MPETETILEYKGWLDYDIIDEIRLIINPKFLGKNAEQNPDGKKFDLQFIRTIVFKSGEIVLQYRPEM